MAQESEVTFHEHRERRCVHTGGVSSGVYGLAFLGAAFYYIQHAAGFWAGVLGVIKALFWPAVLIYQILDYLKL